MTNTAAQDMKDALALSVEVYASLDGDFGGLVTMNEGHAALSDLVAEHVHAAVVAMLEGYGSTQAYWEAAAERGGVPIYEVAELIADCMQERETPTKTAEAVTSYAKEATA